MAFDVNDLNKLSTTEVDQIPDPSIWEEPSEYPPLPPAGKYVTVINEIRDIIESPTHTVTAVLDFSITDGQYAAQRVNFQRLSSKVFERRGGGATSQLFDLAMSAKAIQNGGTPTNPQAWGELLLRMKNNSMRVGGQLDWRAFCNQCYQDKLVKLTGAHDYEEAKLKASDSDKKLASDFATKAKNNREFPENATGGKKDSFACVDCGVEVRAQGRVTRFFAV
jgi:hypothetical protein